TTRFGHLDRVLKWLRAAQCLNCGINATAGGEVYDSLNRVSLRMINDRVGAVLACEALPLEHRIDPDYQARAAKPYPGDRHQPHGSQSENCYTAADRDVCVLSGHKTGREHVAAVDGAFFAHITRDMRQVRVSVVHVEIFSEYSILDVG